MVDVGAGVNQPIINQVEENTMPETNPDGSSYDYRQYNIIKLYHTKTETIEEIPFDQYLYGIVAAEMPAGFELEALKAQAVVARTYTLYKAIINNGKHGDAIICDSHLCCQEWISKEERYEKWGDVNKDANWNKIVEAVEGTKGKVIYYNGEPINAFFHANSGGKTELPINVWGGTGSYPYLQAVATSGEEGYTQYSSELELPKEEIVNKIKETHQDIQIDWTLDNPIEILERTDGDRIRTIRFGNVNLSGVEVRTIFALRSANFTFEILENTVKFSVTGYGHGVGMSQTGADSLAREGKTYIDIINHFYTGVEIKDF